VGVLCEGVSCSSGRVRLGVFLLLVIFVIFEVFCYFVVEQVIFYLVDD